MDIARFSIEKPVITWLVIILFLIGGLVSFSGLGRLEDPEFTIKDAMIFTAYPGASPLEVEEEVTDRIETAVQKLPQLKEIKSNSYPGMSEITVTIKDQFGKQTLPQVWDELRRKVNDVQRELPPGVLPSIVNDDFGDVYGIYFAITGDGYTYREIKEVAKFLRKELFLVENVAKIAMEGNQQEQVFVEISHAKLSQLGISPSLIFDTLESQNLVSPSGKVRVGDEHVRIYPTGEFTSIESIGNLLINQARTEKTDLSKRCCPYFPWICGSPKKYYSF